MSRLNKNVSAEDPASMPTVEQYLDQDRGEPAEFFYENSTEDLGNATIPVERYLSQEWHDQEVTHLWLKTWQMGCRENDIPEVGDQIVFNLAGQSVLIVRSAADEIKAFHNTCLHRGNQLVTDCNSAKHITCSYHGWSWNLDGSIDRIPCRWDFPEVEDENVALAPVRTERWNGIVFINFDDNAVSLNESLGPEIRRQWERWPQHRWWKAAHVAKVLPCNWKATLEAFLESYHVFKVHPQITPHTADCNAKYDFYGPHARMLVLQGAPSPHLGEFEGQAVVDAMIGNAFGDFLSDDKKQSYKLPEDQTPRDMLSDWLRELSKKNGVDLSAHSDSDVLDGIEYFIFPNLILWAGNSLPLAYRMLPYGNDPNQCIFELMIIVPYPEGQPLPKDTQMRMTPTDEPWADAPELGAVGMLVDQDTENLMKIQQGMRSNSFNDIILSNYQERNIKNFHNYLGTALSGSKQA